MKRIIRILTTLVVGIILFGCSSQEKSDSGTFLVAAAASMETSLEELNSIFLEENPDIKLESTYDSSGKLQIQIEEGLEADVFLSASNKQMDVLNEEGLIDSDSIIPLLENKIVLIVPDNSTLEINSFEDILKADKIAIGDPASVPAGQYGKEVLESLGIYDQVEEKASFGTNVTEVLNWVAEGSADIGIVYATDGAKTDKVKIVGEAPDGSLEKPVIYPIGIVKGSDNKDIGEKYIEFLSSDRAKEIFRNYGFHTK